MQLELGTHRLLVEGLAASAVASLIGRAGPDADPPATGTPRVPAAVRRQLLGSGFLWPACPPDDDRRQVPPLPRLAGELTALTAAHGADAAAIVAARRHRCVAVHGAGRVGPHLAAVLAGAGVGRVHLLDRGPVRLTQVMPGGAVPADEGTPLAEAAAEAVTRVAPDTDTRPPSLGDRPDLIVLAVDEPVDPDRRAALHRREAAHLLVRLGPGFGGVGPLVIPGLTSCLGCADRHRLDRDPAWTALAVQLTVPHRSTDCSEVALATMIGGLAALEVLSFLDGGLPASMEATLEVRPPDLRVRRRSWPHHPDCTCMRD